MPLRRLFLLGGLALAAVVAGRCRDACRLPGVSGGHAGQGGSGAGGAQYFKACGCLSRT